MQESSVYQHLVETAAEERYQQGIAQGKREAVLRLLHSQFQNVPASLLERIIKTNGLETPCFSGGRKIRPRVLGHSVFLKKTLDITVKIWFNRCIKLDRHV